MSRCHAFPFQLKVSSTPILDLMADSPSPVRVKWKITTYGKAREAPSFKDEWPDAELDDSGVGNDSFSSIQDSSSFNYDEDNVKMDDTFTRFLKRRDIDEELADLDKDFDELEDDKSSKYRKPTRLEEEIPYRSLIPSVAEEVSDALKSLPGLSRSSKTKPKSKSRSKANARTLSEIRESHVGIHILKHDTAYQMILNRILNHLQRRNYVKLKARVNAC